MANNNLNKKIIELNKQTDETMAKLASQTDKLEGNNIDLTHMNINLSYAQALLKSIKHKINPFQYINVPDIDFKKMFKPITKKKTCNLEVVEEPNTTVEHQINSGLMILKEKQLIIQEELKAQMGQINEITNKVEYNDNKIRANNDLIDDII